MLSVIGADRAGLVDALAEVVADHGGSWDRSQMTELAGVFAGVVVVRLPGDRAAAWREALAPLRERGLLEVTLRSASGDLDDAARSDRDAAPTVEVAVTGADRPGIVHELSHALAALDVGIVDLRTWTASAPMAGELLFHATAVVRLPVGVTTRDLTTALESLADDLMVDLADA